MDKENNSVPPTTPSHSYRLHHQQEECASPPMATIEAYTEFIENQNLNEEQEPPFSFEEVQSIRRTTFDSLSPQARHQRDQIYSRISSLIENEPNHDIGKNHHDHNTYLYIIDTFFRCVLASLYEVVSVRRSVGLLGLLNVLHVLHTCATYMCLICPWTHRWPTGPCFITNCDTYHSFTYGEGGSLDTFPTRHRRSNKSGILFNPPT